MSEPIGVGDWVECIRAEPDFARSRVLSLGAVYQVSRVFEVGPGFDDAGEIIIALSGVDPGLNDQGYPYAGFSPDRFRPIYRPKSELIEGLKTPMSATDHNRELVREISERVPFGATWP